MAKRVAGLILSGGKSSRMGGIPKALCRINEEETFLEKIVKEMKTAGIEEIYVVTGFHHREIYEFCQERLKNAISTIIENKEWEKGMLSSLQTFLKFAMSKEYTGVVMNLVDFPLVEVDTYKKILDLSQEKKIVIPKYQGKKGHPVFWGKRFWPQFFELPSDVGPREVNRRNAGAIRYIPVDDKGVILNINTIEDYKQIFEKEVEVYE